jgi:hypothetical protein
MDMDREVNIPLLRKSVEWAEAEAAKPYTECLWFQGDWVMLPEESERVDEEGAVHVKCGTAYCIAGWTAAETLASDERLDSDGNVYNKAGEFVEDCEDRARRLLGLGSWEASALFDAGNTIEKVREVAEQIAGERL